MGIDVINEGGVKKQFTVVAPHSIETKTRNEPVEAEPKVGELLFFTVWEPPLIGDSDMVKEKYLGFLTSTTRKEEDTIYGGEDLYAGISMLADMFALDLNIWVPAWSRSQEYQLTRSGGRFKRYETTIPSDEDLEDVFRSIRAREERKNLVGESYLPRLRDRIQNRNRDEDLRNLSSEDAVRMERILTKVLS